MNMVDPGYLLNGSLSQQKAYKALRELRVDLTIVGGRTVYARPDSGSVPGR